MKNIRFLTLVVLMVAMIAPAPVQAARIADPGNSTNRLTLDIVCDGSVICRIQNSTLSILNGSAIWFYQKPPAASDGVFDGLISLEMQSGASRGFALFGSNGGYITLGRNGEGSLARFLARVNIAPAVPGPQDGTFLYHATGTYIFN
jgi:hypothetical protein